MFFSDKIFQSLPSQNILNSASASTGRSINRMPSYGTQSDGGKQRTSSAERRARFKKFIDRYEINSTFASRLEKLDGYEIVFICDDSGSMNTELSDVSGPYNKPPTRWDELKCTVSIVVEIATAFDPDGVDIYFLNREPIFNVCSPEELIPIFAKPPAGPTPIVRVLRQVLHDKKREIDAGKLLILLATDGAPTDDQGHLKVDELRHVLQHERNSKNSIPVTIIACTEKQKLDQAVFLSDDKNTMSYLNDWDKEIPDLDVIDDYKSEKKEILKVQGKSFPFSFGDYVVKILMGGIDKWFDLLDEVRITTDEYGRTKSTTTQ